MPFKTREFYKVVGQDGYDLFSHTVNWLDYLGKTYEHPEDRRTPTVYPPLRPCTTHVVHASHKPYLALRYGFIRATRVAPNLYLRMLVVRGTPVASDGGRSGHASKYGFHQLDVLTELTHVDVRDMLNGLTNYDLWGNWL